MMPSAQQQQLTNIKQSMKPKIGFSIDSIVGGGGRGGGGNVRRSSDSFCEDSDDASNYISKSPKLPTSLNNNNNNNSNKGNFNDEYSQLIRRARCVSPSSLRNDNSFDYDRESSVDQDHQNNNSDNSSKALRSRSSSPVSQHHHNHHHEQQASVQKSPIIVPGIPAGIIRPHTAQLPPHYPEHSHNPHLLAQFQAMNALANVHAAQQGFNGHLPPHHLPPHLHNPNLSRDSYPLYPWLLSRHGRIFPHRFPGSEYRKTRRKLIIKK